MFDLEALRRPVDRLDYNPRFVTVSGAGILANPEIAGYVSSNFGVLQLNMWGSRTVTDFDGEELEADVVVAADGALSGMAREAGLRKPLDPSQFVLGVKGLYKLDAGVLEDRFGLDSGQGAAELLVDRACLLTLTAPEMTALVGGMRALNANTGQSAVTNSGGNYSMNGLGPGSYTLTPSKAGYTFTPATLDSSTSSRVSAW